MLGTYQPQIGNHVHTANSFLAASLLACGATFLAVQLGAGIVKKAEKEVEVSFVEAIKLEPPKPQQPIELPKKLLPPPEPVVAPNVKTIRTTQPIKIKQMQAPIVMRKGALAEADASAEKGVYVYGDPNGAGTQAQALPTSAQAPVPLPSNREPEYPLVAKKEGKSGLVILKLVIGLDGGVADIRVLKGNEPFLAEALAAVKTWKYKPATVDGNPISVYHVVKIPFRYEA